MATTTKTKTGRKINAPKPITFEALAEDVANLCTMAEIGNHYFKQLPKNAQLKLMSLKGVADAEKLRRRLANMALPAKPIKP